MFLLQIEIKVKSRSGKAEAQLVENSLQSNLNFAENTATNSSIQTSSCQIAMAPINLHTLKQRSTCGTYNDPCTPHRTAILIILLAIGFLTLSILFWYYLRKRSTVHPGPSRFRPGLIHPQKLHRREGRTTWRHEDRYEGDVGTELPRYEERADAPPPYGNVVARPADAHMESGRRA